MHIEEPEHCQSPPIAQPDSAQWPSSSAADNRSYTLVGPDGRSYRDTAKGILGGHRQDRVYGRLTCPAAAEAIASGGYTAHRVFFASETHAIAAGYRPCAACLPYTYAYWLRSQNSDGSASPPTHESAPDQADADG